MRHTAAVLLLIAAVLPARIAAQTHLVNAFPALTFSAPVALCAPPDSSHRLFVNSQDGVIHVFPDSPGAAWMPFTGVRPLCELRAGIWRIRERWEGVLGAPATAILGAHVAGFHEMDEPPVQPPAPIPGPALICRSDFAPSGEPPELPDGTRRFMHDGVTVAWISIPWL